MTETGTSWGTVVWTGGGQETRLGDRAGSGSPQTAAAKLAGLSGDQLHYLAAAAASVVVCCDTPER